MPNILSTRKQAKISNEKDEVAKLCKFHKIDLSSYKGEQRKDKIARNLVDYEAGLTIYNTMRGIEQAKKDNQITMF